MMPCANRGIKVLAKLVKLVRNICLPFPIVKRTIALCKFHPFHYISKDEMNLHLVLHFGILLDCHNADW